MNRLAADTIFRITTQLVSWVGREAAELENAGFARHEAWLRQTPSGRVTLRLVWKRSAERRILTLRLGKRDRIAVTVDWRAILTEARP